MAVQDEHLQKTRLSLYSDPCWFGDQRMLGGGKKHFCIAPTVWIFREEQRRFTLGTGWDFLHFFHFLHRVFLSRVRSPGRERLVVKKKMKKGEEKQ
jgi:hypothetical protein